MTNPLKQIKDLAEGIRNHRQRLVSLELFQRAANGRIAELEKGITGGVAKDEMIARLIARIDALEKQAKPPVGLDDARSAQGTIEARAINLLRRERRTMSAAEIAELTGDYRHSVYSILSRLAFEGVLVRPRYGHYCLPQDAPARAVGQRNGR